MTARARSRPSSRNSSIRSRKYITVERRTRGENSSIWRSAEAGVRTAWGECGVSLAGDGKAWVQSANDRKLTKKAGEARRIVNLIRFPITRDGVTSRTEFCKLAVSRTQIPSSSHPRPGKLPAHHPARRMRRDRPEHDRGRNERRSHRRRLRLDVSRRRDVRRRHRHQRFLVFARARATSFARCSSRTDMKIISAAFRTCCASSPNARSSARRSRWR